MFSKNAWALKSSTNSPLFVYLGWYMISEMTNSVLLKAQPGVGVIDRRVASGSCRASHSGSSFEKAATDAGGGQDSGIGAIGVEALADHKSSFGPCVSQTQPLQPYLDVEITCLLF